jgi:acyl-CoA thioesterase-2
VTLAKLFELEPHGNDVLVGEGHPYPWGGLYGGHIVTQALIAAAHTVDSEYLPHSLRAYFIRRGDNAATVRYEVDRIRDGKSFVTRRVVARQSVGAILNLEASFQKPEISPAATTVSMPTDIPKPADIP